MRKASEYRRHAQECRDLAARMDSEEQRAQLLDMAEQWDELAGERMALILRRPDLAEEGEHDEVLALGANPRLGRGRPAN